MNLSAHKRIVLAIDTSTAEEAERLVELAQKAGAEFIKFGLELSTATSWKYCSELAAKHSIKWVADAKLHDIPNTTRQTVSNFKHLSHPPFAITMHTSAGIESMRVAQDEAGEIKILGVTILSSISDEEAQRIYQMSAQQKIMSFARDAANAGLAGIVCSPLEIKHVKADADLTSLFLMTPGIRSPYSDAQDQQRVSTPASAVRDGADLLVIGRQITQADDPTAAYAAVISEIEATNEI